ncbi:hypothetical protein L804_05776 [Cryptococcus deuterogattii 2001/935-1]|nr:hypothetical protein L804_05776 [Cryptococcus deuterogattii 2001/935-1]
MLDSESAVTANLQSPSLYQTNGRLSLNRLHPLGSLSKNHDEVGKKLFINDTSATHADSTLLDGMLNRGLMRAGGKDGSMRSYLTKRWAKNMVKIAWDSESM